VSGFCSRRPPSLWLILAAAGLCSVAMLSSIGAEADSASEPAANMPASFGVGVAPKSLPTRATAIDDSDANLRPSPAHERRGLATLSKVSAEPAAYAPATAAVNQRKSSFDLSQVDRVRVRVWGVPELSGVYNVDSDSTVSLPRIGRFDVAGMSLAKFETALAEKLREALRDDAMVSVEVDQFRPYYISGRVARPGANAWRPGLKVIEAVTLAGGLSRPPESAEAKLHQTQTQLTFALAQLERLRCEKEGASGVEISERIASLIRNAPASSQEILTHLMNRQNAMLTDNQTMFRERLAGLQRERESAQNQLDAAEAQEKAVSSQVEIAHSLGSDYDQLRERELVSKNRYLTQRSELLSIEFRLAESHALVARAKSQLSGVEQQIAAIPRQRSAQLNERIETLERNVAELEIALQDAQGLGADLDIQYRVARKDDTGVHTIDATVFTDTLPGDIIFVDRRPDAEVANTHLKLGAVPPPPEVGIASATPPDQPPQK
jgi:exopolysaccharide production protein ExoF